MSGYDPVSIGQQLAAGEAAYRNTDIDIDARQKAFQAKYGVTPAGDLDFVDPKDPFSVTGKIKQLFREQQERNRYGSFAGGYGYDLSTGEQAAKQGISEDERRREITDEYKAGIAGFGSERLANQGGWGVTSAGLNAQLAQSFAQDNDATLGAAPTAAAGVGEKGGAPSTPAAKVVHEFKRVNGKLYRRVKGSNQQWVPTGG
jgi:hypothetical protein